VRLFTVIDIEKLVALARKHVYCWLWLWAGLRGQAILMLCAWLPLMRVGKKLSCSNLYCFNTCLSADRDTQAAGQANGMARMSAALSGYLHITSNYITVRWHVRKSCTSIRSLKPPDQRSKGMSAMARWDG